MTEITTPADHHVDITIAKGTVSKEDENTSSTGHLQTEFGCGETVSQSPPTENDIETSSVCTRSA